MFNNNTKKIHNTFFFFLRNKIADNAAWKNIP